MCACVRACVQVQATVVGFLASIAAVIFGWIPEGHFRLGHAVLLCASSVATAFIASLLLGMTSAQGVGDTHSVWVTFDFLCKLSSLLLFQ